MADICYDYDQEADPVYHQATKCIPEKPIREEKQKASHTSDSTVCPVCDWVHDEEGGWPSVRTERIVQHLHCSSIHPSQHAKLDQVVFNC